MDDLVGASDSETFGDSVAERDENVVRKEDEYVAGGLMEHVESVLDTLTRREAGILRMRYGLNPQGREHTLEEIGNAFDVTRERIRQIEAKALRKLRQASRQTVLVEYLAGAGEDQARGSAVKRVGS